MRRLIGAVSLLVDLVVQVLVHVLVPLRLAVPGLAVGADVLGDDFWLGGVGDPDDDGVFVSIGRGWCGRWRGRCLDWCGGFLSDFLAGGAG